ncbi:hypothetical protein BC567DRAFT_211081 [Phyllosticta citribraziliensis]
MAHPSIRLAVFLSLFLRLLAFSPQPVSQLSPFSKVSSFIYPTHRGIPTQRRVLGRRPPTYGRTDTSDGGSAKERRAARQRQARTPASQASPPAAERIRAAQPRCLPDVTYADRVSEVLRCRSVRAFDVRLRVWLCGVEMWMRCGGKT